MNQTTHKINAQDIIAHTYWQPLGQSYWVELETTLADGLKWHTDWAPLIEGGSRFVTIDYNIDCPNPGKLVVIANVVPHESGNVRAPGGAPQEPQPAPDAHLEAVFEDRFSME